MLIDRAKTTIEAAVNMGARSSPGNPCDGQILAGRIEQTTHLLHPDGHPNSPTYGHLKLPHL
ncbi:MAG: hypothetical protein ACOVN7_03105, partial [Rubrivivax sp.]